MSNTDNKNADKNTDRNTDNKYRKLGIRMMLISLNLLIAFVIFLQTETSRATEIVLSVKIPVEIDATARLLVYGSRNPNSIEPLFVDGKMDLSGNAELLNHMETQISSFQINNDIIRMDKEYYEFLKKMLFPIFIFNRP